MNPIAGIRQQARTNRDSKLYFKRQPRLRQIRGVRCILNLTEGDAVHGIFINYRRDDSGPYAGRIHDRLIAHFEPSAVFEDRYSIPPGTFFDEVIAKKEKACCAVVALVGPKWLSLCGEDGRPRILQEDDWVRREIAGALRSGICVIPVLVGGARMPKREQVPADIADFTRANAIVMPDDALFDDAVDKLIGELWKRQSAVWRIVHPLSNSRGAKTKTLTILGITVALTIASMFVFESSPATRDQPVGAFEIAFMFLFWLAVSWAVLWLWKRLSGFRRAV